MPQIVEKIISPEWIIPVARKNQPSEQVLSKHSVVVDQGKIIDILPNSELSKRYQTQQHFELAGQALIPGLINAHTHAAMSLFKGLADDLPLMMWLENHIWPAEQKWVSDEFCHDGISLAIAEMLKGGTTCFNDMYFQPNISAKVAQKYGMRATLGMLMFDFPTIWANKPDEYLQKGLALRDDYKHNPLLQFAFAPHAPYTVSDAPLKKLATISNELAIPVHIHVHETAQEIQDSIKEHGKRPLARLHDLGLVSPNLLAVHMTQLKPNEIKLLAKNGVHVIHCPQSNMKLASGICPLADLLEAGVNVALGTDGSASNNDLDMLTEMESAAMLGKVFAGNPQACSAQEMLYMATLGGAKALGLEDVCGSIEIGKAADLVALDFNNIFSQPLYDPISQIVYTAGREQVSHVWVNGECKVADSKLTQFDEDALIATAKKWQSKIQAR